MPAQPMFVQFWGWVSVTRSLWTLALIQWLAGFGVSPVETEVVFQALGLPAEGAGACGVASACLGFLT